MEPLDQAIAEALDDNRSAPHAVHAAEPAHILAIGASDDLRSLVMRSTSGRHRCVCVADLNQARAAIRRSRFDVIVLHSAIADDDEPDLSALLAKISPSTKLMIVSESASADVAMRALRSGAVDLIGLPADAADFARRLESAVIKSRVERQRDERLSRLKKICTELNVVRHEITKQVDSLSNDLINAYGEIAEQMTDVAMASEFRTLLKQELDVEDLLRTTLEYFLTKTGPTNAAVFLPDSARHAGDQHFGLGAYVNCDCPRETISLLLEHLGRAICPQMADEDEIVSFADAREFSEWIGADAVGGGLLSESQVIAFSCRHKGECLAVIVLFRHKSKPFEEKLAGVIDTLRDILAEQLSNVIRVHHRARPSWPKDAHGADGEWEGDCHDDLGFGFEGGLAA